MPYGTYVKWSVTIVVPTAVFYLLMDKTTMNVLLVGVIAIGLCWAFLLIFRLIVIPGSNEEREALSEQDAIARAKETLRKIRQHVDEGFDEAKELVECAQVLFSSATSFLELLAGDDANSVDFAAGVEGNLSTIESKLAEIKRLRLDDDPKTIQVFVRVARATNEKLRSMTDDYRKGRLSSAMDALTALEKTYRREGYAVRHDREKGAN